MNKKLTLTIEQKVIERAKIYARDKNRSLSDIIENYLKSLTEKEVDSAPNLSPAVESLKGSFKPPKNFDYKKQLQNRLEKKYLYWKKYYLIPMSYWTFSSTENRFPNILPRY